MKNLYLSICLVVILNTIMYAQQINYSYLNTSIENLQNHLNKNEEYFINKNLNILNYQGKKGNLDINFYKTISDYAIFKFNDVHNYIDYTKAIASNAIFMFKYCASYNDPIVYTFSTSNNNIIRFDFDKPQVSLEYPSSSTNFLYENSEILIPVFICDTDQSYAFHTNLKCSGLSNCNGKLHETKKANARKSGYKICKICTTY